MLAIVTPTFNEAATIEALLDGLRPLGAAVIVVDDGSPDGTANLARRAGATVIERPGKLGLASAYQRGLGEALAVGADPIVQMDADLSHDPADVPRLLEALAQGADLAVGSRYVAGGGTRNWGPHRRALSRFGALYARAWLGLPQRDPTAGFKAWRAPLLQRIGLSDLVTEGYAFQVETLARAARAGARIVEVPIVFKERPAGASKMSLSIALEAARVVPRLRR